ncbi:MAG: alpha/beta fold hydrolase [Gemmatimonadetes bacterium]|nr:alpha/beta fold hydrolase [Gemmatimonadota bacterium]
MSRPGSRVLTLVFASLVSTPAYAQEGADGYQTPAPELAALVDAPITPGVSVSPDESLLLITERASLPSIAQVAAPELRLAGMRINPRTNGPSRVRVTTTGLTLTTIEGAERPISGLPASPRIRNIQWSPSGAHIAFTNDTDAEIQLWVVDVASASARRIEGVRVNDLMGGAVSWVSDDRSLIVKTVPAGRGAAPDEPTIPSGPVIQENSGEPSPAWTYQDLLGNRHDEDLFEHYATAQLARVTLDGSVTTLGEPAMIRDVEPSPDGRHLLVQTTHRPFSYIVPAGRFPNRIEVWDMDGSVAHEVASVPLMDQVPTVYGSVPTGARSIAWRPDADATLYWTEAQDEGDAARPAEVRDAVFMHAAPFEGDAVRIASLPFRYTGVRWAEEGFALVSSQWWLTRESRTYRITPDRPGDADLIFDVSTEDRYADPGTPLTRPTDRGTSVLVTADGGSSIYLAGAGASPEGNRPFLRLRDLDGGTEEELFRSEAPYYEGPMTLLEDGRLITRRESKTDPPNFFLRDLGSGEITALTAFPHPYPQFADIRKEAIQYEREDGMPLSATLYLPAGYDAERDGPLPTFVWAYPREFKDASAAGQRTDSPYQFTRINFSGAVPYVTRGYAVLDNASMPVVGEGDDEPNDTFREQLVANAKAAVEEGVRRGVVDPERVAIGGHSYGAFMTANVLAHSDVFRAGVARSGAYNRTLTPFGFQREQRLFWEAPDLYFYMSPFMHAEKVNEPILLIHGEDDNNSGTYPIQSRRFFAALKGLGAVARLVMLPGESHGYVARESVLHVLWETDRWLEKHVKNATPRKPVTTTDDPDQ